MMLAATPPFYGIVEAIDGYGFLAVLACTRAGRADTRGTANEPYERFVYHGADRIEAILLPWLGTFVGGAGFRESPGRRCCSPWP